ncbi:MAG: hypothetical protein AAGF85_11795 [Bacteroidota bacterium]
MKKEKDTGAGLIKKRRAVLALGLASIPLSVEKGITVQPPFNTY